VTALRLLGAVLAGGEGRRFGGPKGDAVVAGRPMAARAAAVLRPWVEEVVVVSSKPVDVAPCRVIPDRVVQAGPLGGLDAALAEARRTGREGVFLLACDLPLVTGDVVEAVIASLGSAQAAAPMRGPSGVEPLCAVYRVGVHPAVEVRLAGTDRSLHGLFRAVEGVVVPGRALGDHGERAFLNVNTPTDRDRAEAELSRQEGP